MGSLHFCNLSIHLRDVCLAVLQFIQVVLIFNHWVGYFKNVNDRSFPSTTSLCAAQGLRTDWITHGASELGI